MKTAGAAMLQPFVFRQEDSPLRTQRHQAKRRDAASQEFFLLGGVCVFEVHVFVVIFFLSA